MNSFKLNFQGLETIGMISIPVIALFVAILLDFLLYDQRKEVKASKKSIVATGTMVLFYVGYMQLIRFDILELDPLLPRWVVLIGVGMIYVGSALNILGRLTLKANWANHIKIYEDHKLITTGLFKFVRHPLYASLFVLLFGGAIAFSNIACVLLTAFVFIPFMTYRAKQEEKMLIEAFPEYLAYKANTGMFFPKLWR
jgi:protein-S-isoprenylcysteine O-methyltransferase Ste14